MLPRTLRLRGGRDFEAVYASGRRSSFALLGCHVLYGPDPDRRPSRFGFVTSRKVGKAHVRNLVRRRMRAVVASMQAYLAPGARVILVARPAAATATQAELAVVIGKLLVRTGLLPSTPGDPPGNMNPA
ncbi:MAG: ribonuclease P protein component [Candidatus Sericytochromatia bacterium]|nr:ribonuclease P protein component [Candidatus Tanganyikabacteria bacterium]